MDYDLADCLTHYQIGRDCLLPYRRMSVGTSKATLGTSDVIG